MATTGVQGPYTCGLEASPHAGPFVPFAPVGLRVPTIMAEHANNEASHRRESCSSTGSLDWGSECNTPRSMDSHFCFAAMDSPRTQSLNERRARRRNKPVGPSISLSLVKKCETSEGEGSQVEGGGYDHLRGSIILDSMPIEDVCCVPELAPAKLRRGNSVPDINSMKRAIARHQQQEEQTVGRSACHQDAEDAPSLRKMLARSRLGKMQAPERTPSSIDSDAAFMFDWFVNRRGDMEGRERQCNLDDLFMRSLEALSIPSPLSAAKAQFGSRDRSPETGPKFSGSCSRESPQALFGLDIHGLGKRMSAPASYSSDGLAEHFTHGKRAHG